MYSFSLTLACWGGAVLSPHHRCRYKNEQRCVIHARFLYESFFFLFLKKGTNSDISAKRNERLDFSLDLPRWFKLRDLQDHSPSPAPHPVHLVSHCLPLTRAELVAASPHRWVWPCHRLAPGCPSDSPYCLRGEGWTQNEAGSAQKRVGSIQ